MNTDSIYSSSEWKQIRDKILEEDKECIICGRKESLHVHHKIRYKKGGENSRGNLITVCQYCHRKIHKLDEFYLNNHSPRSFERILSELKNRVIVTPK
jgi:5-methylcytosine-specific restriction endonuclease McrA